MKYLDWLLCDIAGFVFDVPGKLFLRFSDQLEDKPNACRVSGLCTGYPHLYGCGVHCIDYWQIEEMIEIKGLPLGTDCALGKSVCKAHGTVLDFHFNAWCSTELYCQLRELLKDL